MLVSLFVIRILGNFISQKNLVSGASNCCSGRFGQSTSELLFVSIKNDSFLLLPTRRIKISNLKSRSIFSLFLWIGFYSFSASMLANVDSPTCGICYVPWLMTFSTFSILRQRSWSAQALKYIHATVTAKSGSWKCHKNRLIVISFRIPIFTQLLRQIRLSKISKFLFHEFFKFSL